MLVSVFFCGLIKIVRKIKKIYIKKNLDIIISKSIIHNHLRNFKSDDLIKIGASFGVGGITEYWCYLRGRVKYVESAGAGLRLGNIILTKACRLFFFYYL